MGNSLREWWPTRLTGNMSGDVDIFENSTVIRAHQCKAAGNNPFKVGWIACKDCWLSCTDLVPAVCKAVSSIDGLAIVEANGMGDLAGAPFTNWFGGGGPALAELK